MDPLHVLPCFRKYVGANLKGKEGKPLVEMNTKVTIEEDKDENKGDDKENEKEYKEKKGGDEETKNTETEGDDDEEKEIKEHKRKISFPKLPKLPCLSWIVEVQTWYKATNFI